MIRIIRLADGQFSMGGKFFLAGRRASSPPPPNAGPFDFAQRRLARHPSLHFFSDPRISFPAFPAELHIPDAVCPSAIYRTIPQYCRAARSDATARPSVTVHASRAETR